MVLSIQEAQSIYGKLNDQLSNSSYIVGYSPSQNDTAVFESIKGLEIPAEMVHVKRWYRHIASYPNTQFPGVPTTLQQLKLAPVAGGAKPVVGGAKETGAKVAETKGKPAEKDEDDFELFGSDEEVDEAAEQLKEERLKAYEAKKSNKPKLIAKSNIVLDVKPWDDETDMAAIEAAVRSVQADGLLWGASKLVPLAYGIKKLQITCVVEDDKVGTDFLEEEITKHEDLVQSVDIAAFNKI